MTANHNTSRADHRDKVDGVSVLLGKGDGTFGQSSNYVVPADDLPYFSSVAVGDLNGDGKTDVAVGGARGCSVFINKGDGRFVRPRLDYSGGGSGPRSLAVGDLNGDHKLDLVTTGDFEFATTGRASVVVFFNATKR